MEKVTVRIESKIDGEAVEIKTDAEYQFKDGKHWIVYTEYTGNVITKNGILADNDSLLIHRTGGISGDLVFEPGIDTFTDYEALSMNSTLVVHTQQYHLKAGENGILIQVEYALSDGIITNDASINIQITKR